MAGMHDQLAEKRQKRGKRVLLLVIGLVLVVGLVWNYWPVKGHITISRETTYITGPLNPDGTINYVAAMNERLSKGVTPENNAAPLLIQAWGAYVIDEPVRARVFEILQMAPVTETGARGRDLEDVVKNMWPKGAPKGAATRPTRKDVKEHTERVLGRAMEGPWSDDELPAVAAWLKENEKLLAALAEAAKRPRLYMPLVTDSDPPRMLNAGEHVFPMAGAQMCVARAMNKLKRGDAAGACTDVLTALRLGRLTGQGCNTLSLIVSIKMEGMACDAAVTIAASGRLTAGQARAFQTELEVLPPPADVAGTLLYERFGSLDCVMILWQICNAGGAVPEELTPPSAWGEWLTGFYDWDYVLRSFNDLWDTLTEAETSTDPKVRDEARRKLKEILARAERLSDEGWLRFTAANSGGHAATGLRTRMITGVAMTLFVPVCIDFGSEGREAQAHFQLVKLALALAAFKAEKGKYPEKLSELSPGYIKAIPQDSFTNKPLIYKRDGKGYLLYSVGPNMTDDGGVEDKATNKDDIAVRVK